MKNKITTAMKHDGGKPPLDLVPRAIMEGSARAFDFGAKKYARFNFREGAGLSYSRLLASAMRHLVAYNSGEEFDNEVNAEGEMIGSGLCHLDNAAAALAMLMDTRERVLTGYANPALDDRWVRPAKFQETKKRRKHR